MSIAPIKHSVQVKAAPAQAFDLFATRMSDWWPGGENDWEKARRRRHARSDFRREVGRAR